MVRIPLLLRLAFVDELSPARLRAVLDAQALLRLISRRAPA